jgi:hypothetical protein
MIWTELQRSAEKKLNRVQAYHAPVESEVSDNMTNFFTDSSSKIQERRTTNSRTKQAGDISNESANEEDNNNKPDRRGSVFGYNFSYGTSSTGTNSVRLKRVLIKDLNQSNVPDEKVAPLAPEVSDIISIILFV